MFQIFDEDGCFLSLVDTSPAPLFGPQALFATRDNSVIVADSGNHCVKIFKYEVSQSLISSAYNITPMIYLLCIDLKLSFFLRKSISGFYNLIYISSHNFSAQFSVQSLKLLRVGVNHNHRHIITYYITYYMPMITTNTYPNQFEHPYYQLYE